MEAEMNQGAMSPAVSTQLNEKMAGKVIFPSSPEYDTARQAWNLTMDQRPVAIIFVENALDIIEAVTFARAHHLPVAVQGTGHGIKRVANGALLLNTSSMKELRIDPEKQTAWVAAGVKWGEVLEQAQQYGLAPLLGSSPDVGAVGYTLGGGMGWLVRKYGLSADSVISLDVVTADGILRKVSPEENSDLYWAMCGGGSSFGVVTGMEIRLYPVAQVYAGNLFYPPELAAEVFARFNEWVKEAPDELTSAVALMNYPPMPELPPVLSGHSFVIVRGCYCGPVEEGERLLRYWRDWQTPLIDDFKTIPFSAAASISQDPIDPLPFVFTGDWLGDLSAETVDALIRFTLPQGGPPTLVFTEVRHAGGAVAKADPDQNAYSNRAEKFMWSSLGPVMAPEMLAAVHQHLAEMRGALGTARTGKTYMNFLDDEEARARTRDGFSAAAFRRLQAIKARYDPENMFDYNFNIPPLKA